MSNSKQISLNISEAKEFLTHIISNNRYLQENGKLPVATEVIGDSGIGKTSTIIQLANELDLNFVKLNLAQIEELGDYFKKNISDKLSWCPSMFVVYS